MTQEALEASIKHWEENARAETPDDASVDATNCALCLSHWASGHCTHCPVKLHSGHERCNHTPYEAAFKAYADWSDGESDENRAAFHTAAQKEVAFLKTLRTHEG